MHKNENAYVHMVKARNAMLFSLPFFGSLTMNLKLTELSENDRCKTAATDGRRMYYCPEYINKLVEENGNDAYVRSLVAHEALHCVFDHVGGVGNRDSRLWNIACDYVVNSNLKDSGFQLHKSWLYDSKFKDWTAYQIYDHLKDTLKFDKSGKCTNMPGEGGDKLADDHMNSENAPNPKNYGNADDKEYSFDELQEVWQDALSAAYEANKGADHVPNSIHRMMDSLSKPKIKWFEILRNKISEYMKSDYTWIKPNKRFTNSSFILPSMDKVQKISLGVAIDTSGSISSEDLKAFLSEINSIVTMYSEFEINVACFDTKVYSKACIKNQEDFDKYIQKIEGGGGTDFNAWWNWALEEEWYNSCQAILFFTDGYPGGSWLPAEAEQKDIFWIVKGSNNEAPVGTTLFYDDE